MPEGVHGYPRWQGSLRPGPAFPTIAWAEIKRAWQNQWVTSALILVFGFTVLYLYGVYQAGQDAFGGPTHSWNQFKQLLNYPPWGGLPWGGILVAAVMGGPIFLDDARKGALELYSSRAVSRADYLFGKSLAVFLLTWLTLLLPILLYYGAAYLMFEKQPDGWNAVPLGGLGFSLLWATMVTGLALGLSCVAKSSRAATLMLLGGMAVTVVLVDLVSQIAKGVDLQLLSPFLALGQQSEWLFQQPGEANFPWWWGLGVWAGLSIVGWVLVVLKHPRLTGADGGA